MNGSNVLLLPLSYYTPLSAFYCIIAVVAIFLNGSALLVFIKNPQILTRSNFLLLSMTLSDLIINILATPIGAYANARYWWTLSPYTCQFYAFVTTWLSLSSILHITALAFERWRTIRMKKRRRLSARRLIFCISGLWCFSLLYSLCPLLGLSSFGPEPGYSGCSVAWHSRSLTSKAYIIGMFILFFFVPIGIITSCFIRIYLEVRALITSAKRRWGSGTLQTRQSLKAKIRTIRMSVIMTVAFFIAWTPYAIISLQAFFTSHYGDILLNVSASMFAKLSTCYNPIIYFFMYNKFRQAAIHMIIHRQNSRSKSISNNNSSLPKFV